MSAEDLTDIELIINLPGDLVLGVGHPVADGGHLPALQQHQLLVDGRLPLHRHLAKRLPPWRGYNENIISRLSFYAILNLTCRAEVSP